MGGQIRRSPDVSQGTILRNDCLILRIATPFPRDSTLLFLLLPLRGRVGVRETPPTERAGVKEMPPTERVEVKESER